MGRNALSFLSVHPSIIYNSPVLGGSYEKDEAAGKGEQIMPKMSSGNKKNVIYVSVSSKIKKNRKMFGFVLLMLQNIPPRFFT